MCCKGGKVTCPTSELGGEQQGLEERVQVAGSSLVLDAAQIASSSRWRWLISHLWSSSLGGSRREAFLLLLLKKIPKHVVFGFVSLLLRCVSVMQQMCVRTPAPLAISSWFCRVLCWRWPGSLWSRKTSRGWTSRQVPERKVFLGVAGWRTEQLHSSAKTKRKGEKNHTVGNTHGQSRRPETAPT